jgi:parallel beta-helix repeat protein
MRYIPDYASQTVLQIPEDKNAYINVKNVGASGRGDVNFSASVTNIQDSILTLGSVSDGEGGSISEYRDFLKTGTDLLAFIYSPPGAQQDASVTVPTFTQVGVDFSGSEFTNPNLAPLKYIVFGYDVQTGAVPNAKEVVEIGSKILNPDFWNLDQYVQLNLSKSGQYVVPVVYRIWGSRVDFLGLIGNNSTGYSTSGSFRDLGLTEIPNWDVDRVMPFFLEGVFSVTGADVTVSKRVRGKEKLNIRPTFAGALQNTLQCFSEGVLSKYATGNTVMFVIDDTQYIRNAVVLAATGSIKDVFFPSGTYNSADFSFKSSSSIDYSNITLRGVGESSRVKRLPSNTPSPSNPGLMSFSGAGNNSRIRGVKFDSMVFDGNRNENFSTLSPRESETTVNVEFSDGLTIRNCLVQDNAGQGVRISDSSNISLLNSRISRTGRAYEQNSEPLVVVNSENLVGQGNILELATSSPLVESTDFSTLNGNIVRGCGDKGFDLQSSFQWNSQGNIAYSDNDSIIRSIDTYNNEYSRATIEVRRGFALDPVFMTVTYGGEPVSIVKNSVKAEIFNLTSQGVKGTKAGSFRVIQTADQLEAGIFSLTLPGTTSQQFSGETIIATGLLNNPNGYVYEVRADILIGGGPRGYRPLSIAGVEINSEDYPAVNLVNPSDLLSLQIHSPQGLENDRILIKDFLNTLAGWDQESSYPIYDIDVDTNSIVLDQIEGFIPPNPSVEFSEGKLFIARPNYFVADGNLFVHTF